ncbi:MAG: SH3 domain-containing protein [Acutalibacteraceae bacterium]
MKKSGKLITILLAFSLLFAFSSCAKSDKESDIKAADNEISSAEETNKKTNVTVGYIQVADGEEAADLCSEKDEDTVIAKMFDDEPISVYEIDSDWAKISYGGQIGYVKVSNVSFTSSKEDKTTLAEEKYTTKSSDVDNTANGNNINVNGDINIIYSTDRDGFQYADPRSFSGYSQSSARNAWCSVKSCYIFSQPDENSYKREANMLYYGDAVTVQGSIGSWYYISTDSGNGYDLHGYVKSSRITFGNPPAKSGSYSATHGVVTASSANVRSTPNKETDNNVLFQVYKGQEFDVLSFDGYWYKIVVNGTTCYISYKMVDVW